MKCIYSHIAAIHDYYLGKLAIGTVHCLYSFILVHCFIQQDAAYLYDAFNIVLDAIEYAMIPNFTQIQQSRDMPLQEWQFGRTFQAILKEVTRYTYLYYK